MIESVDVADAHRGAARLAARAEIRDVRMLRTSAEITRLPGASPRLAYQLHSDATVEYESGDKSFVVRNSYRLDIVDRRADSDENPFEDSEAAIARIEFEQAALFTVELEEGDAPPTTEEVEAYAVSTGQFALHPFAREYIYDVTGRLALPSLTIGVLKAPITSFDG